MNTPLPKGGGFKLWLKAGSIGLTVDYTETLGGWLVIGIFPAFISRHSHGNRNDLP